MDVQAPLFGEKAEEGNVLGSDERIEWYEEPEEKEEFAEWVGEVKGTGLEVVLGKFAVSGCSTHVSSYGGLMMV